MGSVLLHIAHEAGGVDGVLADDEPVGLLLPDVLAAAEVAPNGALWRLAPSDGAPLQLRTLNVPVTLVVNRANSGGRRHIEWAWRLAVRELGTLIAGDWQRLGLTL